MNLNILNYYIDILSLNRKRGGVIDLIVFYVIEIST